MQILDGPVLPPASGTAKNLVVFLHGYGSNGADLISIGHEWADELPDTAFVSPNAPTVCEVFAGGYQWFSLRMADGISQDVLERAGVVQDAAAALNPYIDAQLEKWNLPESRLAVVGFSQGAMMAMYVMPRRKKPCAGVVGYSGLLVGAEELAQGEGIVRMPVLAIHGARDDVVPPSSLQGVQEGFETAGFDVETILRPGLPHSIDAFGLMSGASFLQEVFENKAE